MANQSRIKGIRLCLPSSFSGKSMSNKPRQKLNGRHEVQALSPPIISKDDDLRCLSSSSCSSSSLILARPCRTMLPVELHNNDADDHHHRHHENIVDAFLTSDAQLEVFSFLDLDSLRKVMATNKGFRSLLVSESSHHPLWRSICQTKFHVCDSSKHHGDRMVACDFQDDCQLPIAASPENKDAFIRYNRVNLPLLLSMIPNQDRIPTAMDESVDCIVDDGDVLQLQQNTVSGIQVVLDDTSEMGSVNGADEDPIIPRRDKQEQNGIRIKIADSSVGSGQVYSVSANHPLPRPRPSLREGKNKMIRRLRTRSRPTWKPIVVPFSSLADDPNTRKVHLTPRLVSYFEISVAATATAASCSSNNERRANRNVSFDMLDQPGDCIVIGLATQGFYCHSTLPGWDIVSFGYHSDDGGLYHGSGHARQKTKSFGLGDTVGMGIDYVTKRIFITKNGRFLGYAFEAFKAESLANTDWYPVIGMDSKDTVIVNYGGIDQPFHFDLASYCHRQQQQLTKAKHRISTRYRFVTDSKFEK